MQGSQAIDLPAFAERLMRPEVLAQFLAQVEAGLVPGDRAGLHRRAVLLRGLGRLAEALTVYRDLLRDDPDDVDARAGARVLAGEPIVTPHAGPMPFVRLLDFLDASTEAQLWALLTDPAQAFVPAGVMQAVGASQVKPDVRQGLRLRNSQSLRAWFLPRIEAAIAAADIFARLGLPSIAVERWELQVTGYGDGGFFQCHTDVSPNPASPIHGRYLTFVYYCHRQPRRFSGGDLLLFDSDFSTDLRFTRLDPAPNTLVLFDPHARHGVTPTRCPSDDVFDGRWSVHGWLLRPESA